MHITLSPTRSDARIALHRAGDVVSVNGIAFDLGPLPEGAMLPRAAVAGDWLAGDLTRSGGVLRLTVALPHGIDAGEDARFPAPLDPVPQGPVDLPGHPGGGAGVDVGVIDWMQAVTAQSAADTARAIWREAREVSKLDLVLAMVQAGMISPTSAIAAAGGAIPAEFEPVVAAMPAPAQTEARIRWAGAQVIPRLSPLILAVQAATGMPDAAVDALFGWE